MCESGIVSKAEFQFLLQQAKNTKEIKLISFCVKSIGDTPIGFLGTHYQLTLKYKLHGNDHDEALTFFVKAVPNVPAHAQYVEEIGVFKKEVSLFKTLIPDLLDATSFLQYPWAPKCYIMKNDMLIFEDLSMKNYRIAGGRAILDYEHCAAAVKTLADFHASSIIWEVKTRKRQSNYKINQNYPELVKEGTYVMKEGHRREKWLVNCIESVRHLCDLAGREEESQLIPNIIRNAVSDVGASDKYCNVLSHGDLWSNNFMFKYDSEGRVIHSSLVDFQLTRYSPCALDLICCLHLIATKKLRDAYLAEFISIYFEKLQNVLSQAGLNIGSILSKDELDEGCRYYKMTALAEACLFGIIIWIPGDLISDSQSNPDMVKEVVSGNQIPLLTKAFKEDDFFRSQMTEAIQELVSHGRSLLFI